MRLAFALLTLGLAAPLSAQPFVQPSVAQPAAPQPAMSAPANPFAQLFTRWDGVNRESMDAEIGAAQPAPDPTYGSIPAYSPLQSRSEAEAIALGERVGQVVRAGDCAEGERLARQAGDFALVRAVLEHCGRPR